MSLSLGCMALHVVVALATTASLVCPTRLATSGAAAARAAPPVAQFGGLPNLKVQKSERLLIREAWERADAYRPGKPNWFTQKQKEWYGIRLLLIRECLACSHNRNVVHTQAIIGYLLCVG